MKLPPLNRRRYRCLTCGNETHFTRYTYPGVPGTTLVCECESKRVRLLRGTDREPSRVKEWPSKETAPP